MKKLHFILSFLLICCLVFEAKSQQESGRITIDFDNNWRFREGTYWYARRYISEDQNWTVINLPHDWSISGRHDPGAATGSNGAFLPYGEGWYRKYFRINDLPARDKIFIEFDGIYLVSDVWINGVWLGTNINGYMGFRYDLTPFLIPDRENVIAVRVKNTPPGIRWYSGSGIYRHVRIVGAAKLYIDYNGTYITTPEITSSFSKARLETTVINEFSGQSSFTILTEIFEKTTGTKVAENVREMNIPAKDTLVAVQDFKIPKPKLWSCEEPNLYIASTKLISDHITTDNYETCFGIRSFEFTPEEGFFLNGRNMKIRGVCLHHDGGCVGAAVPERVWIRRLQLLKEMGCNAIRTSHNPQAPEFMDLCDKMGFLVMDEAFDKFDFPAQDFQETGNINENDKHEYFDRFLINDLKRFVLRDRNHPCVIIWSIGNELIQQNLPVKGPAMAKQMVDIIHDLDPTRPVTSGNNMSVSAHLTGFTDILDIAGYNYAPQFNTCDWERSARPDRKFIGTESARGLSTRGCYFFSDSGRIISRQVNYFSEYNDPEWRRIGAEMDWKYCTDRDWFAGVFLWTGIDYLGETQGGWPNKNGNFGALDLAGFKKDAFYFYQSVWTEKPMAHIMPHWNWKGKEGTLIPVWVYTNTGEAELFLNDKSLGRRKMDPEKSLHMEWKVKYEPGELVVLTYKDDKVWAKDMVSTTGAPSRLSIMADTYELQADGHDVVNVEVSVVDENGLTVPDANNRIYFDIMGEGRLIGIDNGDPTNVEGFNGDSRNAFNGLCMGVIQSSMQKGEINILVRSEGLKSDSIRIKTR